MSKKQFKPTAQHQVMREIIHKADPAEILATALSHPALAGMTYESLTYLLDETIEWMLEEPVTGSGAGAVECEDRTG